MRTRPDEIRIKCVSIWCHVVVMRRIGRDTFKWTLSGRTVREAIAAYRWSREHGVFG